MSNETADEQAPESDSETFTDAVLGPSVREDRWVKRWLSLSGPARVTIAATVLGALLFIPFLGAVGLWDPWEGHYGEVAREMIWRNDYVHPFWENAWFFSKPAFTMWMQA